DVLETAAAKDLALPGHVVLAFEAVRIRAVAAVLLEDGARNAEAGILRKALQEELQMIGLERDVPVEVADDLVVQALDALVAGIERMDLGGEAAFLADRPVDHLDPRMLVRIP